MLDRAAAYYAVQGWVCVLVLATYVDRIQDGHNPGSRRLKVLYVGSSNIRRVGGCVVSFGHNTCKGKEDRKSSCKGHPFTQSTK